MVITDVVHLMHPRDVTSQLRNMAAESDVQCEIEVLQSIYLDELTVTRNNEGGWRVSMMLHPSTGEDCLAQFVRLTLTLDLDSEYPASTPHISIHHPRGLSDEKLLSLQHSLCLEAEECVGMPVLYQLIEKAKEILTESNIPHGSCVICLYGFKEGEVFTKTTCYHYFHSHCLGRYITHSEEELQERVRELEEDKTRDREQDQELCVVCPVCREPLMYNVNALLSCPQPNYPQQEDEAVTGEFKRKWVELQKILDRQREKGGVIDPEAESNRFLIHINDVPTDSSDPICTNAPDPAQALPPPPPPPEGPNQNPRPAPVENTSHPPHRQAPHGRRQQAGFRGGRRDRGKGEGGRGGHAAHAVPPPVLENMAKLSVSASESSRSNGAPEDTREHRDGHLAVVKDQPRRALVEVTGKTSHEETPGSKHEQHVPLDSAQTGARERGSRQDRERGRRYGPHGPSYSHWHERNAQWDNGGNVHHHHLRGARGHRTGHYRGNGKSWHQRTESELRKEGVL
ncbi:E3 ubiquitin-protein ligase RNF25 isoform X1 [Hemibagrus wyckioides]|uniref:E3 ubiquitin-protein ligase RNF25 isoform X1 n=1 Tax=Hemibagrus wyckioides TaxID=337641 RepID=UPI00266D818B|nr:E3 ubiquitin-protein ligase RNF25 isoform X1 [Hemibagrus wyckioides]